MALTRKASDAGLKIVDEARQQKCYDKYASSWYGKAKVSKSTLEKFWRRDEIRHENFDAICAAVGVDWQTVVDEIDRGSANFQQPEAKKLDKFNGLKIAKQIHDWLTALRYEFEAHEDCQSSYCEWIIRVNNDWDGFNRVLIRGIRGEAKIKDFNDLKASVDSLGVDRGFLIVTLRVSPIVKSELQQEYNKNLRCLTLDEFIDMRVNFAPYIEWLEKEIETKGIDRRYVSLACEKAEIDLKNQSSIDPKNYYGELEGWIEGYVNQWLSDDSKEHVSILGEFGTGKTWFVLHYAWECLKAYKKAKLEGVERPRFPIVITLRDYSKSLDVENVLAGFFYSKYKISLNSSIFDCLNQMGKLIIIFDGFDEMADKVDRQKMINNFWELARVVCPGSKVILTSRTEHFPHDRESRQLLNAELESSTAKLKWESPRFELLELAKFNESQIREVLTNEAEEKGLSTDIVEKVMVRSELLDLARRPVMTELIIEAMPEIEAGKPVDMSRIYYYAIVRKMNNDIKTERTFTSLADKLYFLCEIAWEMLSTERMKLNYKDFPDRIRKIFPRLVTEKQDLDHWQYDMMGQTILIRDADGYYTPAHRSLLEFLVAYKFAAEAGVLKADFVEAVQDQTDCIDRDAMPQDYTWTGYLQACVAAKCEGKKIAPLRGFIPESSEYLRHTFGREPLTKAVIDLIVLMLEPTNFQPLLDLIHNTKGKTEQATGWIGGNAATLLVKHDTEALKEQDLSHAQMASSYLVGANLQGVNFTNTNLTNSIFESILPSTVLAIATSQDGKFFATGHQDNNIRIWDVITEQLIHIFSGHNDSVDTVTISSDCQWLLSGSRDNTIKRWNTKTGQCVQTYDGHTSWINTVVISPDGKWFVSESYDRTIKRWDTVTGTCLHTYTEHLNLANALATAPNSKWFLSGSRDKTIKRWDVETDTCLHTYIGHQNSVDAVAISSDGKWFLSSSDNIIKQWETETGQCIQTFDGQQKSIITIAISPDDRWFVSGSRDASIERWDIETVQCTHTYIGHTDVINQVAILSDGKYLVSGSLDSTLKHWNIETGQCNHTYIGYEKAEFTSVSVSYDGKYLHSKNNQSIVKQCDINTGKCISSDVEYESLFKKISISDDNEWAVTTKHWYGSDRNTIERKDVYNTQENNYIGSRKYQSATNGVATSPDGEWLVSYSRDKTIKRWDKSSGKCLQTYIGHEEAVNGVAISPDSDWLVSYSHDRTIKRWDKSSDKCLQTYIGHKEAINGVIISPDSLYIISYGSDSIRTWNVETGKCTYTISEQPCAGMQIGGAIGLTSGQIESLKALGAVDD